MNIPTKALQNGFTMPVYGFGLWQVGGKRTAVYENDAADIATIRTAIDLGVQHFDTAEAYGAGHSEEVLGQAIQGYDRRSLFLSTKVTGEHQTYEGVHAALTASLQRLGTDYVDLYILHEYPMPGIPIQDTMRALNELVDAGKIRHIGVSNMTPRRLAGAQSYSKHKIVYNQIHYNVKYREAEHSGILKYCQDNDILLAAWRPLQKNVLEQSDLIDSLAAKYNKTSNQIALNWLVSQKNVVTLSKTSSIDHLKENIAAVDWQMDEADIEKIRAGYPDQESISDTYPLEYPGDVPAY